MSQPKGPEKATRLTLIAFFCFLALFLNLFHMQILKSAYYKRLSEKNRIRVLYLEGPRGRLLDRKGREMAINRLSFNCSAVPREASPRLRETLTTLSELLGEEKETLKKRFLHGKPGIYQTVVLAEDISPSQAMAIEERLDQLPGILIETRPQRVYPYGESAAHVTGFIGPLTDEETDELEFYDYRPMDWIGRDGLEKQYESYLRGRSGGLQIEVNNRGRLVRALGVKEPREGKDVQLTVDAELGRRVDEWLAPYKGAVFVMNLEDGGLLAVNSHPSFDPNFFASRKGRKHVDPFLTDARAPMMNRGLRGQYPAGSIFKIVTTLAALEEAKVSPSKTVVCQGFVMIGGIRFGCWNEKGHGPQDLTEAIAHSCNAYFYTLGLIAGVDRLHGMALQMGFAKTTGIDLPGEKAGFVPSREWKRSERHAPWYDGETANLAIGQGALQVTPLQALTMAAAVAKNGEVVTPHLLSKIEGVRAWEKRARHVHLKEKNLAALKQGLEKAVQSETGTGRLSRVPGLRIAAKTGTAQSGQNVTHAWFVGYAPAEKPKIAVSVFLENGGRGGVTAAGVASQVFAWLKETGDL